MKRVEVRDLSKSFDGQKVFSDINMTFPEGMITAVLGPSGRGKTTLLRIMCGLERADSGAIDVPAETSFSFAFQEHRLIPWMSVGRNMEYSLGKDGVARAREWAVELEIADIWERLPAELSGGQRQRANLMRALSSEADIVLMDEPFNSIGLAMKAGLLPRLRGRLKGEGRTIAMVTHSPIDVALAADCFYLMDGDGAGSSGPYNVEVGEGERKLGDESIGREVHRLMLLMASLGTGVGE